ncbi:MAG: hypothetical protein Q9209_000963 [Squamulea sp. 1 TL-2023]
MGHAQRLISFQLHRYRRAVADPRTQRQKRLAKALFSAATPSTIVDITLDSDAINPLVVVLEQGLQDRVQDFYQPILDSCGFDLTDDKADSIITLVEAVAGYIRNETERQFNINSVYEAMCKKNGKVTKAGNIPINVRQGLFSLFGYLTMLFDTPNFKNPSPRERSFSATTLAILEPFNPLILMTEKPIDHTNKEIGRLLGSFGDFVPRPKKKPLASIRQWPPKQPDSLELSTSVMNIYALTNIGKIKLIWSDLFGAHLMFDNDKRTLTLFRFPTFCALNHCPAEKRTLFDHIMDADSGPDGPTVMGQDIANRSMFQETLLTYRLLFGQNRHARWLYNTREKKRASAHGKTDPLLNRLCGERKNISHLTKEDIFYERGFYNSKKDFPHYEKRFIILHTYTKDRKARNVRDVWRDRREPERWVVVWFAVIFSIVTIVLSLIQIFLGGVQVKIGKAQVRLAEAQLAAGV